MKFRSKLKHALSRVATVAIVVIIIIIIAAGGYYALTLPKSPTSSSTTTPTTSSSTSSSSSSSGSTSGAPPSSAAVDEIPGPVSVDPSSSYDVPGGEIMQNVYQSLIFYNGTSTTQFVGVLAKNWTQSNSGLTYTFNLWPFATFSDGTALNASSVWFAFYRTMLINGGLSFYISQYLSVNGGAGFKGNSTDPTSLIQKAEIELPNGTVQALQAGGYSITGTTATANDTAALDLASILSNFNPANSTIQTIMSYPSQAVVVSGPDQITMHLQFPFSDFYATISGTDAAVMDPAFIDAHGGVQVDTANSYVNENALGSGPYTLTTPLGGSFVKLVANANYWAKNIPTGQSNPWLAVPKIGTIVINYQNSESVRISDIESNTVQFSTVEVPDLHELSSYTNVAIHNWGPTATIDFVTMDAYQYPFNYTTVREAVSHGINTTQIQSQVYSGYSTNYVGPLDPQMPYYNSSIAGYSYSQNLAISLLAQAPFQITLPNGTVYNKGSTPFPSLPLIYTAGSVADQEEATIIASQLQLIGIPVAPIPTAFVTIINAEAVNAANSPNYPGFQIAGNQPVFLGPTDPVNYLANCAARCHHGDPAFLNSTAVGQLYVESSHTANTIQLQQIYNNITTTVNSLYQYVWLDDFSAFTVASTSMQGLNYNTALDGIFYATVT